MVAPRWGEETRGGHSPRSFSFAKRTSRLGAPVRPAPSPQRGEVPERQRGDEGATGANGATPVIHAPQNPAPEQGSATAGGRIPRMGMGRRHCMEWYGYQAFPPARSRPGFRVVRADRSVSRPFLAGWISGPDSRRSACGDHHRTPDTKLGVTGSRTRLPVR